MATNAYAPYPPEIVGDSWVPIVEDPFIPQTRNEQGYWFNLSASSTVVTSRIYVAENSTSFAASSIPVTNIYPENGLDWGPVQTVDIPCFGVTVTDAGDTITVFSSSVPTTPVGALYSPHDTSYIQVRGTSSAIIGVDLNFNVTNFSTQLSGKRILKVEFVYTTFSWDVASGTAAMDASYASNNGAGVGTTIGYLEEANLSAIATVDKPSSIEIPLATFAYTTATSSITSGDRLPFNYTSLARFDPTTTLAQRLAVGLLLTGVDGSTAIGDDFGLSYAALRVTYCNETRVGIGGRTAEMLTPQYGFGPKGTAFSMPILNTTYSGAPTLDPGNYYVTLDNYPPPSSASATPPLRALRQLYTQPYPGIHGITIPITTTPDEATVAEPSDLLPAISLHTSSAVVADSHGYGQQLRAPVYSGVTASQDILNAANAASQPYSMVRFYARRFGETTGPLGLRLQSSSTVVASISVDEFDALDEIADGWKQVDLTFDTPPTFNTSGNSTFEWFSNTSIGAQWQVLGATSPNVTGFTFAEVGPQHWLGPTTYGGITQVSTWDQGSGAATIDREGDITLMFATVPQMEGLEAAGASVELEYLEECERAPGAIPTAVDYIHLTWDGSSADVLGDTFTRDEVSGWGTAETGQAWSIQEGTNIYSVANGVGVATPALAATSYILTATGTSYANVNATAQFIPPSVPADTQNAYILVRYADTNNYYYYRMSFNTDGTVGVSINKRVAGVNTTIAFMVYPGTMIVPGEPVNIRAVALGSLFMVRIWGDDQPEPTEWHGEATDTAITSGGTIGIRFFNNATGWTLETDNITASSGFGAIELQREDDYTDWQTIMLATSPLVTDFNDYEARVGVESRYRIRVCHELDFCGEWSDEAAYTLTAPGVSGTDIADSVMIFTSNARQDGSSILAYVEAFDGTPAETFSMFEASDVTLQPMYNRNYRVAFHGTERGGQQFSRNILLNNAGVTIINFEQAGDALRNLAWESTPYVAVRDGHGSRWFANVMVPQITIQPPRHALQYAQVTITEVTDTAWPVNP